MFVDAGTGHIAVEFQSALTKEETISAIDRYEDKAKDYGIIVKEYQFDNGGAFTLQQLRETLSQQSQKYRYSGAGSHHQNGRAEQAIQTVMAMGRTMLIHQAAHWQQKLDTAAETSRWPMAVKLATHIYNHVPKIENGLTTHEMWTRTREPKRKLHNLHAVSYTHLTLPTKA